MINTKHLFGEEINSTKKDLNIKEINKKCFNTSYENLDYSNFTDFEKKKKNIRGRQLFPNIYSFSKKNNSSLATKCESKKRIGTKSII